MKEFDRRTMLRYSGLAATSLAFRPRLFAWADAQPVATTTAGKVSGAVENGIHVFRGIPYGADTSKTRFKPPLPAAPWSGVKECVDWSTRAPQLVAPRMPAGAGPTPASAPAAMGFHLPPDKGVQSEDCLHLNVWTPQLRDGGKRPVLVYFHGGAYNNGTVNCDLYDGNRLCHRGDVVVVTVNHRLNAFGFLYLGGQFGGEEYAESGNVGMLDLVLALKWIRDNIPEFGGDPSRVLIFGQSGGGAKCATLMAMPAGKGYFHRVLTMSGQQLKGASIEIASARTQIVLDKLGVKPGNLAPLKLIPMETIQAAARTSSDWLPVVDGVALPRNPFDPDAPALSESVPMILGNTHDETRVVRPGQEITWDEAPEVLKAAVAWYLGPIPPEEVVKKYRQIYPNYTPNQVVTAAATAFRAWPGQVMEAERRASNPKSQPRTWVYQMNWKVPFPGLGAPHTIDLPFMWDNVALAPGMCGASEADQAAAQPLATTMSETLIAYARTGNPNHKGLPYWPSYDLTERNTMIWDNTVRVEKDPRGAERRFAAGSPYHQPGT